MRVLGLEKVEIDGIDKTILNSLMDDARMPISRIAKEVGVSTTAIHQRIKKMEKAGLILGAKTIINTELLGYYTTAFLGIYVDKSSNFKRVVEQFSKIPEIIESYVITGEYTIFLKVLCRDNKHLMEVLNHYIQEIDGVERTETLISLQQQINKQIKL